MYVEDNGIGTLPQRLLETLAVIERMLDEQRRVDYFEALRQKKASGSASNVTAAFFAGQS